MEGMIMTLLAIGIGLALFMFFADQIIGAVMAMISSPDRLALTALFIYITFFTNIGMFIRPYFTPMNEWSVRDELYEYSFKGTGTFINHNHVLTNEHVATGCKGLKIHTQNNTFDGHLIATDKQWDLALIETRANSPLYAVIRQKIHINEEEVVFPDYTTSPGKFSIKTGNILRKEQLDTPEQETAPDKDEVYFSGYIRQGNSGSPLYDTKGYLIGVIKAAVIRFDPFYFGESAQVASSLKPLLAFLHKHNIPYSRSPDGRENFFTRQDYTDNMAVGVLCGNKKALAL